MRTRLGRALRKTPVGTGAHQHPQSPRSGLIQVGLAGLLLACLAPAPAARTPKYGPQEALGEGAVDNRVRVPVSLAWDTLAMGDTAWREIQASSDPSNALALGEVFEAWRRALESSTPSEAVPNVHPDLELEITFDPLRARSYESVDAAIARRLETMSSAQRNAWTDRFETLAETAPDDRTCARLHPGTRAAVRAQLRLADRALAEGRHLAGKTYAGRAAARARWLGDPALQQAASLRAAAVQGATWQPSTASKSALQADSLSVLGTTSIADPLMAAGALPGSPPGRGLIPDGVFLRDGRLAVQTPSRLVLIDAVEREVDVAVEGAVRMQQGLGPPALPFPTRQSPGWWLRPATDGTRLAWVEGRRRPGEATGNALVVWTPPPPRKVDELARPSLQTASGQWLWALRGAERWRFGGALERLPRMENWTSAEWQGGPALSGRQLIAAARTGEDERSTRLAAFDVLDGEVLWTAQVDEGSERQPAAMRFGSGRESQGACAPLTEREGRILVVSHLGTASLFDALDGRRLWTVRLRRAPVESTTWAGSFAHLGPQHALVAAADSDRLYRLPNDLLRSAVPEAPLHRSGGIALFGADLDASGRTTAAWTQARFGADPTLRRLDLATGAWSDTTDLRTERWSDGARHLGARILAASDQSVCLFDATGDLRLLDQRPLPAQPPRGFGARRRGGPLHINGDLAVLIEADRLVWLRLAKRSND